MDQALQPREIIIGSSRGGAETKETLVAFSASLANLLHSRCVLMNFEKSPLQDLLPKEHRTIQKLFFGLLSVIVPLWFNKA
jgi:hypothetical protein